MADSEGIAGSPLPSDILKTHESYHSPQTTMAEPQPPAVHEGAPDPTDEPPAIAPPASAEDRRAAAALSTLDAQHHEDPSTSTSSAAAKTTKNIDQEALAKAISRLEFSTGEKETEISEREREWNERRRRAREEREARGKGVKVEPGDVALLVRELEVGKGRAGEMLRSCGGDVVRAMRGFVRGEV
ncbi:MAG: hypothetical protein Q9208_006045 [Pyrenodesmia sp. 3 TL-2023]